MHLVDVHAHLDHEQFRGELPALISRWKAKGIVAVVAQGLNHESNRRVLELAKLDPTIKIAMGLYPCEMLSIRVQPEYVRETTVSVDETLAFIERHKDSIVAIGEVGMDGAESDDLAMQREEFRKVVRLAKRLRKPLIIHSRKAEKEVMDLLEEEQYTRAVMHCFTGSKKLLARGVKLGLMFSIPTAVVRNQQFRQNVEELPIGNILQETDAPYMGPMRDIRNEPANIREALHAIAEIKRMDPLETANVLYFNYQKMFQ